MVKLALLSNLAALFLVSQK